MKKISVIFYLALFAMIQSNAQQVTPSPEQIKAYSPEWKGERLGINEMRRHYTNYFKGIHGFKEYKQKLVTTDGINQLLDVFTEIEAFAVTN